MTLLSSPFQTTPSRSLSPISDPHSDPLALVDAEISPLDERAGCCIPGARLKLAVREARSDEKESLAVVPLREKSDVDTGDPTGSRLPTKKLGFRDPSMPRPPPAAMAVALNTAAAFLLSSKACRRSTTASRRPSILYGRAICKRGQRICGVHNEEVGEGKELVYKKCSRA
jgi:hypothetical protein